MNRELLAKFRYILSACATMLGAGYSNTDVREKAMSQPCPQNGAFFHGKGSKPQQRNRKFKKKLRYTSPYA